MTLSDLKRILKLLGPKGTAAGLKASDVTVDALRELALKSHALLEESSIDDRERAIDLLVNSISKSEIKPLEELMEMSFDQLVNYFESVRVSSDELMKLVKQLNFKVGAEDRKHLKKYVARQISETALFTKVAGREGR
jgi:hypothetical protein